MDHPERKVLRTPMQRLMQFVTFRNKYRPADNSLGWCARRLPRLSAAAHRRAASPLLLAAPAPPAPPATRRRWTQFVQDYFAEGAVVCLAFDTAPQHPFSPGALLPPQPPSEVPFHLLPRLFQIKYGAGLRSEFLCMSAYSEFALPSGHTLIVCPGANEFSIYDGYCVSK
jgi:hypothetical protein